VMYFGLKRLMVDPRWDGDDYATPLPTAENSKSAPRTESR
jgi:hypothetical protein